MCIAAQPSKRTMRSATSPDSPATCMMPVGTRNSATATSSASVASRIRCLRESIFQPRLRSYFEKSVPSCMSLSIMAEMVVIVWLTMRFSPTAVGSTCAGTLGTPRIGSAASL